MERMSSLESMLILGLTFVVIAAAVMWAGQVQHRYAQLARLTLTLTFIVVVLGAFVRLTDAGLGCPDWPGCYGDLTPTAAREHISAAELANPSGPVTMAKAWKEMGHRYLAALLGSLIVALAIAAWRSRTAWDSSPRLAASIVGVVLLQGALGAWTVTLLLKPAIVTGHLIGGMLTLSLLCWLSLSAQPTLSKPFLMINDALRKPCHVLARWALGVLAVQIVLGGWVSTNYAALACMDFPTCQGHWIPPMTLEHTFDLLRPLGSTTQGDPLPFAALTTIHFTHRVFAIVVICVLGSLGWRLLRTPGLQTLGKMLLLLLAAQVALGVANVLLSLPLAVAVAHNGTAGLLLLTLICVLFHTKATPNRQLKTAT